MRIRNELFDVLREFRRELAMERGVPPYIVFSDATLGEISAVVPQNEADFRSISGVGEQKWQQFGVEFLKKIDEFLIEKPDFITSGAVQKVISPPIKANQAAKESTIEKLKIPTTQVTFDLYKNGLSVDEIAEQRFLSPLTINAHLAQAYEEGRDIDINHFVSAEDVTAISEAFDVFPEPYKLKDIFEYFSEKFTYSQIRFALALRNKNK